MNETPARRTLVVILSGLAIVTAGLGGADFGQFLAHHHNTHPVVVDCHGPRDCGYADNGVNGDY